MNVAGLATVGQSPARPRSEPSGTRLPGLWAGLGALVALWCLVGRPDVARAESGTVRRGTAAGLRMEVDTRWLSGNGYRPVRITVTPVAPVVADRTLTVEFSTRRHWDPRWDNLRVIQEIEIPAGSGAIQTTMSVPQMVGWSEYTVNVVEDGKAILPLCHSAPGDQNASWGEGERSPGILVVGVRLPETGVIAGLLNMSDSNGSVQQMGGGGMMVTPGPVVMPPLPTAIAKPAADLPRRWIDYTNVDLIFLSREQLAALASTQPEVFAAILAWTAAGGNLCVFGIGSDWGGLPEVESLVGLAPGTADTSSDPASRGWTEPEARLFGRPIRGVGTNVTDPFEHANEQLDEDTSTRPPPRAQRPSLAPSLLHDFDMGLIVALADESPFPGEAYQWSWLLNSIGSGRFLWCQRHGLSPTRENGEFWNFLIPGVGLAPVTGFRVLITLFVLGIGPLNYYLLRRWKSLHWLVVTVPLSALAITVALFTYAMVADGLGTRVRVRSVTRIDQGRGHAVCWSRLSFYAGLAPFGGLTFPDDVEVIPFEYLPGEEQSRTRELIWESDQRLVAGWLASRTPTQFITVRSRPTGAHLAITSSEESPGSLRVVNGLGTRIEQLLVRAQNGQSFWAAGVDAAASAEATPVAPNDAEFRLRQTFREREPAYPPGMDRRGLSASSGFRGYRQPWRWMGSQADLPPATQRTSLLEMSLLEAQAAKLEPGSYVAVVERSPEVVTGTASGREEAGLHVVLGRWGRDEHHGGTEN
ncbi:MAG: hypothetical protein ABIK89_13395, partial [Planctomycetota bacterium]